MSEDTKKCPMCGEEILAIAKKCKHCGEMLGQESALKKKIDNIGDKKIPGWVGVLAVVGSLVFIVSIPMWGKNSSNSNQQSGSSNNLTHYAGQIMRQIHGEFGNVAVTDSETLWSGKTNNGNNAYIVRTNYKFSMSDMEEFAGMKCSYAMFYLKDGVAQTLPDSQIVIPCFERGAFENRYIRKISESGF